MYILLKEYRERERGSREILFFNIFDYFENIFLFFPHNYKYINQFVRPCLKSMGMRFVMKGDIFSQSSSYTTTIISASAELFGKFRFSLFGHFRARRTGDWACANYILLALAYMKTRERERERKGACMSIYTHVYMWTASIVTTCDGRKKRSESNRCIAIAFTYAYSNYIFCVLDPNSRRQHK